jgi:hypothetical protein
MYLTDEEFERCRRDFEEVGRRRLMGSALLAFFEGSEANICK